METQNKPTKETLEEWHNDPSNWFLGVFYFNKKDKRVFLPKRFSFLGWTVNFANPYSIVVLVGIIVLAMSVHRLFR